jgi:hypothetical protein
LPWERFEIMSLAFLSLLRCHVIVDGAFSVRFTISLKVY